MNFFGDGPLGPWDVPFTFMEDLGCGSTLLGFVLFLVVVAVTWWVFFG
jgi:hypothetical protein